MFLMEKSNLNLQSNRLSTLLLEQFLLWQRKSARAAVVSWPKRRKRQRSCFRVLLPFSPPVYGETSAKNDIRRKAADPKMTFKDTFRSLRTANPDVAIGLGYSKGEHAPMVLSEGPLWRGSSEQVGAGARWHIGSITKTMTATAVLQLVDQGKLDLDQPIGDVIDARDDMHADWRVITLAQLLSHTSGLAPNPPVWQFFRWRDLGAATGRRKVLARAWAKPPKYKPGKHRYSNLGYMLIGVVLEDVLGMPWEDIMQQNIVAPLGLSKTGFGAPQGLADPKGHRRSLFRLRPMERDDIAADNPRWLGPAGTAHMSIDDLLSYGRAHLRAARGEMPDFLSQNISQLMRTPVSNDYGLGWVIQDGTVWHNGSNAMWYAILMIDPASDTVVAATQNAMIRTPKIDALAHETQRMA